MTHTGSNLSQLRSQRRLQPRHPLNQRRRSQRMRSQRKRRQRRNLSQSLLIRRGKQLTLRLHLLRRVAYTRNPLRLQKYLVQAMNWKPPRSLNLKKDLRPLPRKLTPPKMRNLQRNLTLPLILSLKRNLSLQLMQIHQSRFLHLTLIQSLRRNLSLLRRLRHLPSFQSLRNLHLPLF